jgi:hypothetical protein
MYDHLLDKLHSIMLQCINSKVELITEDCNMSFYEDDESSGEEFMDKINVYLNKSTQNRDPSSLQGILRPQASSNTKQVTFSVDEMEAEDTRRDTSRSKEELLSKVARLTDILKESEKQVADEKDKRKKKEKK